MGFRDNQAGVVLAASDETKAAFASVFGSLEKLDKMSDGVASKLKGGLAGIAAGLSVGALKGYFDKVVEGAGALKDLSEVTGASVENLSRLQGVAKLAGTDIQSVGDMLTSLTRRLKGIGDEGEGQGGKGAAKQLEELGISAKTATGELKDPAELMIEIAGSLNTYAEGLGKSQAAQELFGRSGAKNIPFLKELAEAGELNARMTAEQAAQADLYIKNMKRLDAIGDAWKKTVVMGILPAMTGLSEAMLEAKKEGDSLNKTIAALKEDGSIEEWARTGALGMARIIDAARLATSSLTALGGILAVMGRGGEIFAARMEKAFVYSQTAIDTTMPPGMKAILRNRADARVDAAKNAAIDEQDMLGRALTDLGNTPSVYSKLEDEYKRQDASGAFKRTNKPSLAGNTTGGKGSAAVSEYDKLIASIKEKIALQDLEFASDDKVTEGQKMAAKVMVDLRDGKLALNDAQKIGLTLLLEELIAGERKNEQAKIALKQLEEDNRFRKEQLNNQIKSLEAIDAEVEAMRKANEEIGLNKDQLVALNFARLEDTIAIKTRQLAIEEATGTSAASIETMKDEIAKLRELQSLRNDGAVKQKIADKLKDAEDQVKRTADTIEHSLTDALMRGFESGKSSAQVFRDTLYNMFRTLVLKPIIEAQVKPFATAASQALGGFDLSRLFGGGGSSQAGSGYNFVNEAGMADYGIGFASGGSFQVGGNGGTDSQLVAFRASPDERVTITRPDQQGGDGGNVTIVQHINVDARSDQASIRAAMIQAKESAKSEIADLMRRNNAAFARAS